jgi:MFS family permease
MLLWLSQIQAHPAYLTHLLPAQLLGGAGVGLTIPSLLAAGSASLPPDRFGTGSGILNMARQVGTVLGVAGLIAILAHVSTGPTRRHLRARRGPHHRLLRRRRPVVAAALLTARTRASPPSRRRSAPSSAARTRPRRSPPSSASARPASLTQPDPDRR